MIGIESQITDNSFELDQESQWLKYLHENGSVVVRNVLSKEEVAHATDLFWEWL